MVSVLLADLVVVIHLGFVGFVAVGGFLAWRHPRVVAAHGSAVAWALGIVTIGWSCPLTGLENALLERAGSDGYSGGFVDRYLTGVLYPERYEVLMQGIVAAAVVCSYAGFALRRRERIKQHRDQRNDVVRRSRAAAGRARAVRPAPLGSGILDANIETLDEAPVGSADADADADAWTQSRARPRVRQARHHQVI
jgi:hypothetical protein